jgi:ribonuclease D
MLLLVAKLFRMDFMDEEREYTESPQMVYVADSHSLAALCENWSQLEALAVDTEFMRTNTFYAKLGLLQIGVGHCSYLLDPLEIDDWAPFEALCRAGIVEFIFHSCSEDLSVFLSHFGFVPERIFDTQLAASFLGLGPSLSYAALVLLRLDAVIEKDVTRSDWLQRPLTDAQLRYAAIDVVHLIDLRNQLLSELHERNMSDWFVIECQNLIRTALNNESESSWSMLYRSLGNAWRLSSAGLILLRELSVWREKEARRRDKPKSWILKDNDLIEIAGVLSGVNTSGEPGSDARLLINGGGLSRVEASALKRYGSVFIKLAENCDYTTKIDNADLSAPLTPEMRKRLKRLQAVVTSAAEAHGLAPEVLARKRQLLAYMHLMDAEPEKGAWPSELSLWKRELLQVGFEGVLDS